MSLLPQTRFTLPAELSASEPPEARGLARDEVRLLVVDGDQAVHARFRDLGRFLNAGDLLVVNTSATLAAAVDGVRRADAAAGGIPVVVHFSTAFGDGTWMVELRSAPTAARPILDAAPGDRVELAGAELILLSAHRRAREGDARSNWINKEGRGDGGIRLWRACVRGVESVEAFLAREGRAITYGYVTERWPLASYQTVFASEPGSAEMPSAGRPFTGNLVTRLVASGVLFAPIVLHAGVSSLESDEPPPAERFRVPQATARLVDWTRRSGGRVIAVGTTVARALESAVREDGSVAEAGGWTELFLGPSRPASVIDGIVTGLHDPNSSHLLLLEAIVGAAIVRRAYDAALESRYLWHEFGDVCLLFAGAERSTRQLPEAASSGTTRERSVPA